MRLLPGIKNGRTEQLDFLKANVENHLRNKRKGTWSSFSNTKLLKKMNRRTKKQRQKGSKNKSEEGD